MSFYLNPEFVLGKGPTSAPDVKKWPEASGQSFKKGQFVRLAVDTGVAKVTACATNEIIWGIANEDASTVEDTDIEVTKINIGDVIRLNWFYDSTAVVPAIGTAYEYAVASNKCKLDADETGTDCLVVHEIVDEDKLVCEVTVVPTKLQAVYGI